MAHAEKTFSITRNDEAGILEIMLGGVAVLRAQYNYDLESFVLLPQTALISRLITPYLNSDIPNVDSLAKIASSFITENQAFFAGWCDRSTLEKPSPRSQTAWAGSIVEPSQMSDIIIVHREPKPDPLGRQEKSIAERLRAMAEDALNHKDDDAVESEADVARNLLGFKK
jgi:hypothetical protein